MFKTHYLQKTWRALSLKCDGSLSELQKATQAPTETEVELRKNMVQDPWKEVTAYCILVAWKKLCPQYAINFKGFDLTGVFRRSPSSWQRMSAWTSPRKKAPAVLETIDEELSTDELDKLEKQRRQLEEEVEAQ